MIARCPQCSLAVACQKRNNPPAVCMQEDSAKTQVGLWQNISRMSKVEYAMRASCIDNECGRCDF
jgi:hypothetical protein